MAELIRDTSGNKVSTGSGGLELDPNGTDVVTINNGVMLPDGSLAEPSIRFSDDTNCGVLSLVNDQINMAAHGLELTRFTGVASAVNYLELKNSITTADLSIGALGTDTNISINLIPKGSGTVKVGGTNVALVGANLSTFTNDSGFITSYTVTEGDVTAHEAALTITESQISDLGSYITDYTVTEGDVTAHEAALTITESQISDLGSYLTDVVGDTTPQLGGNLDVQANSITTSTVDGGITLTPNGTGDVTLGTMVFDADQTIGAGQDDYVLTYDNSTGKISLEEAAGGGGGAAGYLYTDTPTTAPVGTGTGTLVIGDGADASTYNDAILIGNGTSVNVNEGICIGVNAVCNGSGSGDKLAIGKNATCGFQFATAIGAFSNAGNTLDTVLGRNASATGANGTALGAKSNTNSNHGISIGDSNALNTYNIAIGWLANANSGGSSSVAVGATSSTNSQYSSAFGYGATANATRSLALGWSASAGQWGSVAIGMRSHVNFQGEMVFDSSGITNGRAKTSIANQYVETTDATETILGWHYDPDDWTPGVEGIQTTNNRTYLVDVNVVARRTDVDGENAAYNMKACIKRDASAATTALVGSLTKTVLAEDTAAWDVDLTANATSGKIEIKVTGETSKTIRWVATVQLTTVGE